jgi:polysaccharide pyruvyl transferase WcaK-like protein
MKVLIEGAGVVNKGAEAMLRTVQSELGARLPDASFRIESHNVAAGTEEAIAATGCEVVAAMPPWGRRARLRRLVRLMSREPSQAREIWRSRRPALAWDGVLRGVDLVVDVSGLRYSDDVGPGGAMRTAPLIGLARRLGIPYVLLPQSFGPFAPDGPVAKICRESLAEAALIFPRDAVSRRHLAGLLGRDVESLTQSPDIAFRFRSSGKAEGARLLGELGLGKGGRPVVAVSPNMRVYERVEGYGASNPYVQVLTACCRQFTSKGCDVVLVPHEIKRSPRDADDRMLGELIRLGADAGGHGGEGKVAAVTRPTRAEDLKAMIGCCELLVGSRFHAIVAALQQRVPVVAVGWSHKYGELLRDLGLDRFAVGHQVLDSAQVAALIDEAWECRAETRRSLEAALPAIEAASSAVFDRVATLVSATSRPSQGAVTTHLRGTPT